AELEKITARLDSDDPVLAAIAAWRRGALDRPDDDATRELLTAVLGPAGLRRDAAAAALAQSLGKRDDATLGLPPAPRPRNYAAVYERWLIGVLAPSFEPLPAKAIAPVMTEVRAALRASEQGSRAEREAAARARRACDPRERAPAIARAEPGTKERDRRERKHVDRERAAAVERPHDDTALCLSPLVGETLHLSPPARD
ncbi:MAG TPA: hypothetical protein VG755_07670, partial [Nannocystaceae bacterium]|nr:hypothetical protein [Nannocystaceae bacterium]